VVATAVLFLAKEILIPIALAVLLSFLLFPIVYWMEKRGLKRSIAVVITVLIMLSLVGGFGYVVAGQFIEFVDQLPKYRKNIIAKIHAVKPGRESVFKRAEAMIVDISREMEAETTGTAVSPTTGTKTSKVTSAVLGTLTNGAGTTADKQEVTEPRESALRELTDVEDENIPRDEALSMLANAQTGRDISAVDTVPVRVVEGPPNSWQSFQDVVGPIFTIIGNAGLVTLFVIFFLVQREDLRDRVIRLAGHNKVRVTTEALEEAAARVSKYLLMQLIVNVTYGIPVAIGLFFIGVPNALLWGALATILRFIPYIGPWLAASMPIMLSLAVFDNWTMPLLTVGLFVALELISNNVMEPILYGHSTGVSPVAIIVSAVFWTWLWGGVGLVLATPITVCLVVLGRHIPQLAFLHVLLGDEPVLTNDARVYNRLLSGATDEAVDIAEDYVDEKSLPELFDDVLLPALESAETDRGDELLSIDRYHRVIAGMNELLEAVTDKANSDHDLTENKPVSSSTNADIEPQAILPVHRILCVPVNDDTDETAASMLKYLLVEKGDEASVSKSDLLVSEVMDSIRSYEATVVVLSSVPPFAVTHTRYLAKRIAAEFPDLKLYAGLWRGSQTMEKVDERLKDAGVVQIFTSISEAALHI